MWRMCNFISQFLQIKNSLIANNHGYKFGVMGIFQK